MKSETTWQSDFEGERRPWGYLVVAALCFLTAGLIAGCTSTVAPKTVTSSQPSWDAGEQNSGVLAVTDSHSLLITPHARDRYNGLISTYGGKYSPALNLDDGILGTGSNTFLLDAGHAAKFIEMNRWRKQGAPPWVSK